MLLRDDFKKKICVDRECSQKGGGVQPKSQLNIFLKLGFSNRGGGGWFLGEKQNLAHFLAKNSQNLAKISIFGSKM